MLLREKGFTLVELLIAMGIVVILAGVVLVSMQYFFKKARVSKAFAVVSQVKPQIISCMGNGGRIKSPPEVTVINPICEMQNTDGTWSEKRSYGEWPKLPSGYRYIQRDNTGTACTPTYDLTAFDSIDCWNIAVCSSEQDKIMFWCTSFDVTGQTLQSDDVSNIGLENCVYHDSSYWNSYCI